MVSIIVNGNGTSGSQDIAKKSTIGNDRMILQIDIGRCGMSANETTLHQSHNLKIKVNRYRSKYGLQHGTLAHTKQ